MGKQEAAGLFKWGCSSVGRAPALQAGGQEFESLHLHSLREAKAELNRTLFCRKAEEGAMYLENHIYEDRRLRSHTVETSRKTNRNREEKQSFRRKYSLRKTFRGVCDLGICFHAILQISRK